MRIPTFATVLLLVAAVTTSLEAQRESVRAQFRAQRLARLADSIPVNGAVRIAARSQRHEGRFTRVDSAAFHFLVDSAPASFPLAQLDSIWVQKRATANGAMLGMVVGAIGLGMVGAMDEGVPCFSSQNCSSPNLGVLGAIGGAGGGAVIGAIFGSGVFTWKRVFP